MGEPSPRYLTNIQNLTVQYGRFVALDDFSLELPVGCVGLLGPNGAGKTTFLKTLLGFIKPRRGGGSVLGHDIARDGLKIRQSVGYMPEQDCHIPGMTAVQFVAYAGELIGLPKNASMSRAHEVLEYVGLGEARYRPVDTYSTGMKQRVKFAQALVHGPKLLLLDEPTNGLDPQGRREMLGLVKDVCETHQLNALVCSHLLPDIERICDEVILLLGGKLQMQGRISELKQGEAGKISVHLREPSGEFIQLVSEKGMSLVEAKSNQYVLQSHDSHEETVRVLFEVASQVGSQVRNISRAERSLEDVFMEAVRG